MKGKLVVVDGVDGVGKTVQIDLLKEKKSDIVVFKYPTRNYSLLADYLEKKISFEPLALFLLFLSDIANEQRKVKKALEEGKMAILDRYVFSTIAYELEGISYEQGKRIVSECEFLKPDVVLLLDITAEVSQERKKKQKALDRYEENMKFLEKVRSNFSKLYEERFLTSNWHKVDASRDIESVHAEIMDLLS